MIATGRYTRGPTAGQSRTDLSLYKHSNMKRAFAELAPRACRSVHTQTGLQARAALVRPSTHLLALRLNMIYISVTMHLLLLFFQQKFRDMQVFLPAQNHQWQPAAQLHHLHTPQDIQLGRIGLGAASRLAAACSKYCQLMVSLFITKAAPSKLRCSACCCSGQQTRSMFIQTQPTPNPSSMMFLPGQTVMEVSLHLFVSN